MFVDFMADLRKTVAEISFRAQLSAPAPRPVAMPKSLTLSGPAGPDGARSQGTGRPSAPSQTPGSGAESESEPDALAAAFSGATRRRPTARDFAAPAPELARTTTNRGEETVAKPVTTEKTPGRNDPCWCGSGKKFKKCHGQSA